MVGPVLSVLTMGLLPLWGLAGARPLLPERLAVSAPASERESALPFMKLGTGLTASGVLIVDMDSAQTLYESGAQQPRPMASLTKLMTALLIAERHGMDERVRIPSGIEKVEGSKAKLRPGETYTVGALMTALLVQSANDAAVTLALYDSGSVDAFVESMNARAVSLGLKNTSYRNPVGLDAPGQLSTPRDLAWLSMYVLRKPEIAQRMATKSATIRSESGTAIGLSNTNLLLHSSSLVVAGKTGTTDAAGECLFSVVQHGGKRYGVVLLRSADRYADMRKAIAIFQNG